MITDSNQICQSKALKVFHVYLEKGNELNLESKPLIKTLIEKCLIIEKGDIASIATEIMFWMMDHYKENLLN